MTADSARAAVASNLILGISLPLDLQPGSSMAAQEIVAAEKLICCRVRIFLLGNCLVAN